MGRKKEEKESEKENDDAEILCSTARKSDRLAAANAAAAAATNVAAAAAAPAAAAPTATATDALPGIVPKGRFKGYVSPGRVAWEKREQYKWYASLSQAREDFAIGKKKWPMGYRCTSCVGTRC